MHCHFFVQATTICPDALARPISGKKHLWRIFWDEYILCMYCLVWKKSWLLSLFLSKYFIKSSYWVFHHVTFGIDTIAPKWSTKENFEMILYDLITTVWKPNIILFFESYFTYWTLFLYASSDGIVTKKNYLRYTQT